MGRWCLNGDAIVLSERSQQPRMPILFESLQLNRLAQLLICLELRRSHHLAGCATFSCDRLLPEGQADQPFQLCFAQCGPADFLRLVVDVGIDEEPCESASMFGSA